jgi:hypothetical protein
MPPSTASEVFSFFDNIDSLLGVIIISQPSDISALGMTRTIDFLRHKGIPIIGLVSMMDGHLCPSCGLVTHQLLSPKLAMEKMAKDCETNPAEATSTKGRLIGSKDCCQVHVRIILAGSSRGKLARARCLQGDLLRASTTILPLGIGSKPGGTLTPDPEGRE